MMVYLKNKRGITLVEVLVAMAIVGLLGTLAYSLQLFGLRTFTAGGNQANIQQNVRIVSEVFRKDLRNVKELAFVEEGTAIAPGQTSSYQLIDKKFIKTSTINLSIDDVIEEIVISLEGSHGRVLLNFEIKGTNNYSLKDQILLNNLLVEDLDESIILGKNYSLQEYMLIYSQ